MKKRMLMLASVASMIDQFNMPNIKLLLSMGYEVDVVADFTNPGNITVYRARRLRNQLKRMNVHVFDVAIPRSINPKSVLSSYKRVKSIVESENYSLIHCHSPIGGAICRLATKKVRKTGTKVIYTAHGFHFYSGAPLVNWIIFYPIEKILSYYTDVLITINREDYALAQKKMKAKKVVYVPGVGINLRKFRKNSIDRETKRKELGISDGTVLLLSVGELNENKNHETVIRAIADIENLYYIIAGEGGLHNHLQSVIDECFLTNKVKLLGYRNDIGELCEAADIFVMPSFREGLSVALMESMASGLPAACSRIRGNTDLIDEGKGGIMFDPHSVEDVKNSLNRLFISNYSAMGNYNAEKIKRFGIDNVSDEMTKIYKDGLE